MRLLRRKAEKQYCSSGIAAPDPVVLLILFIAKSFQFDRVCLRDIILIHYCWTTIWRFFVSPIVGNSRLVSRDIQTAVYLLGCCLAHFYGRQSCCHGGPCLWVCLYIYSFNFFFLICDDVTFLFLVFVTGLAPLPWFCNARTSLFSLRVVFFVKEETITDVV